MSLKVQAHPRAWWDKNRIQGSQGLALTLLVFTDPEICYERSVVSFQRAGAHGRCGPMPRL